MYVSEFQELPELWAALQHSLSPGTPHSLLPEAVLTAKAEQSHCWSTLVGERLRPMPRPASKLHI